MMARRTPTKTRSPVIAGRVPESLHRQIKAAAKKSNRSLSDEMAWRVGLTLNANDGSDYRIAKLEVKPGDILVVKINTQLSREHAEKVQELIADKLPEGVKTMVVGSEFDFLVLSAEQIEQQTRSAA